MKKLFTLLLVLACYVGTASADNVTKRIVIITSSNFQSNKTGGLAIHAWYSDSGTTLESWGDDAEHMSTIANYNPSSGYGLWSIDLTFDSTKDVKFMVYDWGNKDWKSTDATQQVINSSSNKYYSFDVDDTNKLAERGDLKYYAYLYDGTDWEKTELTSSDEYTKTITIDNQTSFNSSLVLIVAPSFALDDDAFSSNDKRWDFMIRPWGENQDKGFMSQEDLSCGSYASNSNSLKLKNRTYYKFTFYPIGWKYYLNPYIEKQITSVEYATLGTPDGWKMKVPEGVTAYYVTGVADGEATMSSAIAKDKTLPGNNGFLIQGSAGNYKFYASNDDPESTEGNMMVSTGENGVVAGSVPDDAYILALNDEGNEACFYKYSGTGNISAFKAYLNASSPAKSLAFNFDGNKEEEEVTAINAIANTVDSSAAMFNLAGQRVNNDYKGVVVKNGKKFIVK